jgi:hypothetical protein
MSDITWWSHKFSALQTVIPTTNVPVTLNATAVQGMIVHQCQAARDWEPLEQTTAMSRRHRC